MPVVAVSACLLGEPCRYDGRGRASAAVDKWLGDRNAVVIPVCPEQLGGLGTPRPPAWLVGGDGGDVLAGRARVLRQQDGGDVTLAFLSGARRAGDVVRGATEAVLKARSPSCGCGSSWIDGQIRSGDGVFAALLRARGVVLQTEEMLDNEGDDGGR